MTDYRVKLQVMKMLHSFDTLDSNLKGELKKCGRSVGELVDSCEGLHGEGQCEVHHEFMVTKKCPPKTKALGVFKCVEDCPGLPERDEFSCGKLRSFRSQTFPLQECIEKGIDCESFRDIMGIRKCPKQFKLIENDICIFQCPNKFVDLGDRCLKNQISKLPNEIFVLDFN